MQPVADIKRSLDFYTKLGFKTDSYQPEWRWARLSCGECELMLDESIYLHDGIPRCPVIYLYPENIYNFHASGVKQGLDFPPVEETFYGMLEFRINDPDGNRLWVGQEN